MGGFLLVLGVTKGELYIVEGAIPCDRANANLNLPRKLALQIFVHLIRSPKGQGNSTPDLVTVNIGFR